MNSSALKGEHSASECQALPVFVDYNTEEAKQKITDAVHYCLHLL
jgi:hypothetical protein